MGKSRARVALPFPLLLGLGIAALVAVTLLGLGLGAVRMGLGGLREGKDALILLHVRLPRVLAAVLAGAGLATAGVIIQTVLGNPLAGPNIIGVNAGAGFFVVLCAALFPSVYYLVPVAAFLGALFAILFAYLLAYRMGASRMTLILAGVAVSSFLTAGINAVTTLLPDVLVGTNTFRIGGLAGVTLQRLSPAWVIIVVGLLASFLMGHEIDLLGLGDDTAKSLGLPTARYRFLLLGIAAALVGSVVSFAGMIGFVGLIMPHVGRLLVGQESRKLLPISALLGAVFTVACDLLSRWVFAPFELPLGIVLSFIGAPAFVTMLLRRRGRRARDGA